MWARVATAGRARISPMVGACGAAGDGRDGMERVRHDELVVDGFAGGGGATTGIEQALGRPVDIAINHDAAALAVHAANHPRTQHFVSSIYEVDPITATRGRPVGLAWFSPDCRHFSKAKSGTPRSKGVRSLARVALDWAAAVRPRVVMVENVEEFQTWGPLDDEGQPIKARAGEDFRQWLADWTALGYEWEHRVMVAADHGVPTTRKRFFFVARCDGQPITWPEPTHGKGRAREWLPASGIIDWNLPAPSIFDRKRPLAEPTLRRVAVGTRRYVLEAPAPFMAPVKGPVAPVLIQTGYGERPTQAPRVLDLAKPLGTVVAGGSKHGLVLAFLTKHYGGVIGHDLHRPLGTITTQDHHALTTATLAPAANRAAEVRALLARFPDRDGAPSDGIVRVEGVPHVIGDLGMRMLKPRELFAAQGFPADYVIDPMVNGKPVGPTKQTALAGNSVCPALARALVESNLLDYAEAAE